MESTLFLYFLFLLLSEAFCYENNFSFDIVLIAKPKLRRDRSLIITLSKEVSIELSTRSRR